MSDEDIELLESYLDDALSVAEADDLRVRVADDPDLAAALHEFREQRALRAKVWQSLEPLDAAVETLMKGVRLESRKLQLRQRAQTAFRWAGSAAAVLLVGFATGWMGHQRWSTPDTAQRVATGEPAPRELQMVGKLVGVGPNAPSAPYHVTLTDQMGRVIGVQHFNSPDRAKEFTDDLDRWQDRQKQLQDGRIKFIGDEY